MRKNEIKVFIVLLTCTFFIFSFSHFGASAYQSFTSNNSGFETGTMIGPIDVSGKSKDEALVLLTDGLQKWRSETTINLQYKEKNVPVDLTQFQFDLENSVSLAKDGQKNEILVKFKSGDLYRYLKTISNELDSSKVKLDSLQSELITYAANLTSGQYQIKVEKFLTDASNNHEVISEASISPSTIPTELGLLVGELSPIKIEPKSQISLLKLMEERKFTTFPTDAASMIATVVYKTVLASNFTIVEKHSGQVLPDYAELGLEAKIDLDNHLDLVFVNPNEVSYEITLQMDNNTLTAYLKGSSFLNDYKIKLSEKQEFNPKTVIQYSPLLLPGGVKVQQKGKNGQMIDVYREVYGENDEWLSKEFISEDFYPPIPRIEIRGLTSSQSSDGQTGQTGQTNSSTTDGTIQNNNQDTGNTDGTTPSQPTPSNTNDDLFGKPNETTK